MLHNHSWWCLGLYQVIPGVETVPGACQASALALFCLSDPKHWFLKEKFLHKYIGLWKCKLLSAIQYTIWMFWNCSILFLEENVPLPIILTIFFFWQAAFFPRVIKIPNPQLISDHCFLCPWLLILTQNHLCHTFKVLFSFCFEFGFVAKGQT